MTGEKNKKKLQEVSWTAHPARERPRTTILLLLFLVALEVGIYFSFQSFFIVLLAAAFLFTSLSSYFFPTRYKANSEGITVKGIFFRQMRPWSHFRIYYADKRGVQLSTFTRPSRLDPFRGTSLLFSKDNREEVLAFIKERLAQAKEKRLARISSSQVKEKAGGSKRSVGKEVQK